MNTPDDVVFLLDVDNTLLDNDREQGNLRNHLEREFGTANRDRYHPHNRFAYPPADLAIERIGDLLNYDIPALFAPARAVEAEQETT